MFLTVCSFQGTYCVTVFQLLLTVSSHNIKEIFSSILWRETFFSFTIWQPPTFPCRLQHSIIGRLRLNHRVRDENGCFP